MVILPPPPRVTQHCPKSSHNSPMLDQLWPIPNQLWSSLVHVVPTLVAHVVDPRTPSTGSGPTLSNSGPISSEVGQCRAKISQLRRLPDFGRNRPGVSHLRAIGRIWAKLGLHSKNVHNPRPGTLFDHRCVLRAACSTSSTVSGRVGTFTLDASCPITSSLCYNPRAQTPLCFEWAS